MPAAPAVPLLPDTAPFTPGQRAWLNGFFAGVMSLAPATGRTTEATAADTAPPPAPIADEDFPWHDPALGMADRLRLAEGRPRARRLMAAMAQLDCGACGYECQTYAEAIDRGEEKDLGKCSPGGSETAKQLKELVQLTVDAVTAPLTATPPRAAAPAATDAPPAARPRYDRTHPFPARLVTNTSLNTADSAKDTRHIVFSLKDSGLTYEVGDALGVYPENCAADVDRVITLLRASGAEEVPGRETPHGTISLFEALTRQYSLARPTPALVAVLADAATDSEEAARLRALGEDSSALDPWDLLELLEAFPSARPEPANLVGALAALRPRLYSISSSLKAHPDEVHLTVGVVKYASVRGRTRRGVASTCLAERVRPGERLRVYVQHTPHFRLPPAPDTPVIMVGPGTGIAPFRAFLHDRAAAGAKGRNWLFFGEQRERSDFLYRDELESFRRGGVLQRFDTAFSRDGKAKVYVQHRMLEHAAELWRWLQDGAHVYVCGDAKRMAADVDRTLRAIIAERGGLDADAVQNYVTQLSESKRYQRDVY